MKRIALVLLLSLPLACASVPPSGPGGPVAEDSSMREAARTSLIASTLMYDTMMKTAAIAYKGGKLGATPQENELNRRAIVDAARVYLAAAEALRAYIEGRALLYSPDDLTKLLNAVQELAARIGGKP